MYAFKRLNNLYVFNNVESTIIIFKGILVLYIWDSLMNSTLHNKGVNKTFLDHIPRLLFDGTLKLEEYSKEREII